MPAKPIKLKVRVINAKLIYYVLSGMLNSAHSLTLPIVLEYMALFGISCLSKYDIMLR